MTSDLAVFWIGVPLGLLGTPLAAVGYWRRLEKVRSPRPSTRRYCRLAVRRLGLRAAGLLISP